MILAVTIATAVSPFGNVRTAIDVVVADQVDCAGSRSL